MLLMHVGMMHVGMMHVGMMHVGMMHVGMMHVGLMQWVIVMWQSNMLNIYFSPLLYPVLLVQVAASPHLATTLAPASRSASQGMRSTWVSQGHAASCSAFYCHASAPASLSA